MNKQDKQIIIDALELIHDYKSEVLTVTQSYIDETVRLKVTTEYWLKVHNTTKRIYNIKNNIN